MLKFFVFSIFSLLTSLSFAQNDNRCHVSLKNAFWASDFEAQTICTQDSSDRFIGCMEKIGYGPRATAVTSAAVQCNPNIKLPNVYRPDYSKANSCPTKLQVYTGMPQSYALQICNWDDSQGMQSCIIDLTQKARFHVDHSVQYCAFAASEYRPKLSLFTQCVIDRAWRGYGVHGSVSDCDRLISTGKPIEIRPRPLPQPQPLPPPIVKPTPPVPQPPVVQPAPQVPKEVLNPPKQPPTPAQGRKVPTPVEIKIESNQDIKVDDQPLSAESTDNSEALPL